MFHLLSFVWFWLILAGLLGVLVGYVAWFPASKSLEARSKEVVSLKNSLHERDRQILSLKAVHSELVQDLKSELTAAHEERLRLDTMTKEQHTALCQLQSRLQAYMDALAQANENIRTANATIETAKTLLQKQRTE